MKEQVARILGNMAHEIKQRGYKDPAYGLAIKQATLQICQKFPKTVENPDGYEPKFNNALEADAHNWDARELSKPDEGRLLTGRDWEGVNRSCGFDVMDIIINLDDRYSKSDQMEMIVNRCDNTAKAQDTKTASSKDDGCQERVERIKREIEARMYNTIPLMIMPRDWESLWEKELK